MQLRLIILILLLLLTSIAWAGDRVALVIGNGQYQNLSSLKNPISDAEGIAKRLKQLGFDIIRPVRKNTDVQANLSLEEVFTARNAFRKAANNTKIAFLYYAGHGASLGDKREAHLIPVDASKPKQDSTSLDLLERQSLTLDSLLSGLDGKADLTIAVFDACREIPELEKTMGVFDNIRGNAAPWRGLSRPRSGRKRIIAYSAAVGQLAADGDNSYSPYTKSLLDVLEKNPFQEVGNLFRDVAMKVDSFTGQYPEVLIQGVPPNRFYLVKKNLIEEPKVEPVQQVVPQTTQAPVQSKPAAPSRSPYEPEMVFIQGGTYKMGCVSGKDCQGDENVHSVTINDFWIGKYEVTFNEWKNCVDDGGCQSNKKPDDEDWGRGRHPVINVSWYDVNEYATWLSGKTDKNYRLPTEAEWEYAARAENKTVYPWGNNISCQQANYGECNSKRTAPIGSYNSNKWGLYDTVGNVSEWTCSISHYSNNPKDRKYTGIENHCSAEEFTGFRMLRGGSWLNDSKQVRLANRYGIAGRKGYYNVGFRLSLSSGD